MYFLEKIKQNIVDAINKAIGTDVIKTSDLIYPPNLDFGDLSLPCFVVSKKLNKSVVETAEFLISKIKLDNIVIATKIIGPYLNFTLDKIKLAQDIIEEVLKQKEKYGQNKNGKNKKIMVEFAHPNTHKAFHIGHLRNILTGEAVAKILQANGYEIIRANYQGDVGLHIAKCFWGVEQLKKEYQEVSQADLKAKAEFLGQAYSLGSKNYEESEVIKKEIIELNKKIYIQDKSIVEIYKTTREWSLDYFSNIYKKLNTKFDRFYFESEVFNNGREIVLKYLKEGVFKASQGAIIFEGEKYGLHSRVFINSEGNPTYEAKDIGLAELQFKEFNPDKILHVVGPEQMEYFKVIIKVLEIIMPETVGREEHLRYGWVKLKEGKMSSRLGNVILGEWLIDEAKKEVLKIMKDSCETEKKSEVADKISLAAIKYSILKNGLDKDIAFDLKESVSFNGSSGPYLQYTVARINSILRKSNFQFSIFNFQKNLKIKIQKLKLDEPKEHVLVLKLAKYSEIIKIAGKNYDPSEIAKYLFELAQEFNDYYHSVSILKAEIEIMQSRLVLIMAVKQVLENGLGLLGIEVVEEM